MSDVNLDELIKNVENWDSRARERAMEVIRASQSVEIKHWYCKAEGALYGRNCNGRPHGVYAYPHARSDQWPPRGVDWFIWFIMSGRGAGKTRTGSGWSVAMSQKAPKIAAIGRRAADFRNTMVEGPSGLIRACEAAGQTYDWKPALKRFEFQNGAVLRGFSGEEPDSLRGEENAAAWFDEPAHMPLIQDVYDNLVLGLRMPGVPGGAKILMTSTPLPTKWVKETIAKDNARLVRVSTKVNLENLDRTFIDNVIKPLEGTRMGRQELEGIILDDVEGALWSNSMIVRSDVAIQDMERIVIAIDPAGTSNKRSDETGIVAVGRIGDIGYVLADKSGKYSPQGWAMEARNLYEELKADAIIVETNFGGDMVKENLKINGFEGLILEGRATRGKQTRAEPVVARYEQSKMAHAGSFPDLETEMTTWIPGQGASPNRVDALVWAFTEVFKLQHQAAFRSPRGQRMALESQAQPSHGRSLNPIQRLQQDQARRARAARKGTR